MQILHYKKTNCSNMLTIVVYDAILDIWNNILHGYVRLQGYIYIEENLRIIIIICDMCECPLHIQRLIYLQTGFLAFCYETRLTVKY